MNQEPQRPMPPRAKKPAQRVPASQTQARPTASKTLIIVRLCVALAAVLAAAGVAVYAIHSKMSAPSSEDSTNLNSSTNTGRTRSTSNTQPQSRPQSTPSSPAGRSAPAVSSTDVAENCRKWATQVNEALKAVTEADSVVAERLRAIARERKAAVQIERDKLRALDQRLQSAESAAKEAERRQLEAEEEVRTLIAGQAPIARLFVALDALDECEAHLGIAKAKETESSTTLAALESKLRTTPQDRELKTKLVDAQKAYNIAMKSRSAAQASLERAQEQLDKAWKNIQGDSPKTKSLMEAGAKLKTARDIVGKCESELVASETEVTRLDNELKLRTVEANAAAEVYKPIRQHFFELKKTASRLEELYKADKESDRYKDDAIAARKAVDDYKSTHDEALEAKQKADKLCQDARTKLNAANRDASRTRQALTDAQKALATERSAFVTSTKALRHEEEAKDKVRSDKLLKAKQAAAAAAEAATAANDAWYDLDTERTALESSIAALDAAQRDDAIPGVETEAKDALEALKKAISVLAGKPNPTAGDINLVLSSATDAQRACDSATKDRSLDRFSEAHAMASVVAERRVAHKNATAVSGAIAWDAAELRDKRVK